MVFFVMLGRGYCNILVVSFGIAFIALFRMLCQPFQPKLLEQRSTSRILVLGCLRNLELDFVSSVKSLRKVSVSVTEYAVKQLTIRNSRGTEVHGSGISRVATTSLFIDVRLNKGKLYSSRLHRSRLQTLKSFKKSRRAQLCDNVII